MSRARTQSGAGGALPCLNEDDRFGLIGRERDRPLSFQWHLCDADLSALGLPLARGPIAAARSAIFAEALLAQDEGRRVSFSRRRAFYPGQRRYRGPGFTYDCVFRAVDEAVGRGLLQENRAEPGTRGWQSQFWATPELIGLLGDVDPDYELSGLIRLKDGCGKLIDFPETDRSRQMHREIVAINADLGSISLDVDARDVGRTRHHIYIDGVAFRPTRPGVYRVFNRGRFSYGGRAYGWWQTMPKRRRRQLLISGETVAEPDFRQMHAAILYAQHGKPLDHDPYETGVFSREQGKLAFNVALNAPTLPAAIGALTVKSEWPLSWSKTACLIEALKRRNPVIADALHADQGIKLMRIDSDISIKVVKRCLGEGIPVLPVHDSMITPARHQQRVAEIMEASAAQILKVANACPVKLS